MKITDEMLYRHAAEARDIWLDTLPDDNEIPEHQFSDEFNKEMDRLITLSHKRKQPSRRLQRIAAMFAVIIIGASSFIGVNAEARAAFFGWIKELTDDYLIYRYEEEPVSDAGPASNVESLAYLPTWIPEGYSKSFVNDKTNRTVVAYSNDAGELIRLSYIYNSGETDWFISTESTVKESATVNGNKADLFISTDPDTSGGGIWVDQSNTVFMLTGFLDVDDLLKMAESIQPVDHSELENNPVEPITDVHYGLTAIPEGYIEIQSDYNYNSGSQHFENEAGQALTFDYTLNSRRSNTIIDAADATKYQTFVNGYEADVVISSNVNILSSVTWVDDENTVFRISSFLGADEMIKLAESIEHVVVEELTPSLGSLRYEPTLIPEGYSWHRETDTGSVRMIVFKNEAGQLLRYTYIYDPTSVSSFLVAEGSTHSIIDINGYQADMLMFDDFAHANCIVWIDENECAHEIHGFLDKGALIEVAESVKIVD